MGYASHVSRVAWQSLWDWVSRSPTVGRLTNNDLFAQPMNEYRV